MAVWEKLPGDRRFQDFTFAGSTLAIKILPDACISGESIARIYDRTAGAPEALQDFCRKICAEARAVLEEHKFRITQKEY